MAPGALASQHAVTGPSDSPELLDVDVDQLAPPGALVALGGLHPHPAKLAHPDRREDPRDRRDAIPSSSAISAPVKRSRRSAAIASTRRSSVRLATTAGAEDRSSSPAGPPAR